MKKIAAIGEVLFDIFNGKEVIGGAPFNFISHISHFSNLFNLELSTGLVTKVGMDERGDIIKKYLDALRLPTELVQSSEDQNTGSVNVYLNSIGIPEYDIIENTAYDYIDFDKSLKNYIQKSINFFYFGTLFQRTAHNRQTLSKCLPEENIFDQKIFCDINLRQDYYNWDIIDNSLLYADFLKVNESEIVTLEEIFFRKKKITNQDDFIEFLIKNYILDAIIITRGEKGASIYTINDEWHKDGKLCEDIQDTVGAGDGFSSIFALGIMFKWNFKVILDRAVEFSSEICKLEGAVPDNAEWYQQFKHWF